MNLAQKIAAILSEQGPAGSIYKYDNTGRFVDYTEPFRLFRILYAQSPEDIQKQFAPLLLKQIHSGNAKFACHAILEIERITYLNQILLRPMSNGYVVQQVLQGLAERLRLEPHKFSAADLDDLDVTLRQVAGLKYTGANVYDARVEVAQRINTARYGMLKTELLKGVNPEINTDKEALLSRLASLGFRVEIAQALEGVDQKLGSAATALDFKGVMDVARGIYEEVFEDAANSVAKVRKKTISAGSHFNPFKTFLVNENVLSVDEGELSQKLYNYLSNSGSHALSSAPEQARLTKNIVIEICLLVLGRVQNAK